MFERERPIRDPVTIRIDGRQLPAERGEPLAIALLAASEMVLARSPKLHRPRGPACLRGDCDGCIARVDGVPNVMTCLRDVRGGEEVVIQNVIGSAETDLLRITDWFFPSGIDHHHLLAGIPGVGAAMQTFARQMAGIGRLPDTPVAALPAATRTCDVLIVGGGLAGLAAARALASGGRSVMVCDDGPTAGGSALFDRVAAKQATTLAETVAGGRGEILIRSSVLGIYEGRALVGAESGAQLIEPRGILIASGAHDGVLCAEGNDLPGVISARALCALAIRGIVPKGGAVIVGKGPWAKRLESAIHGRVSASLDADEVRTIKGRTRVKGVVKHDGTRLQCSVVATALPGAPSFELAVQAGATTRPGEGGFEVVTDEAGRAAENVWAAGECTGMRFDPERLIIAGERAAAAIQRHLG
jgi:sarcosine oxidase subunit alpha